MSDMSFEQVLTLSATLSPLEKVQLIEHVMHSLKNDIQSNQPRELLYGIWQDTSISPQDIDEARKELWRPFPREDV